MSTLTITELEVGYPTPFGLTRLIAGANASIPSGSMAALLGPSGAGKTTILKCVAGLLAPIAGRIEFRERALDTLDVAFAFQEPKLIPWMSALQNVQLFLPGGQRAGRASAAEAVLGKLGFESADFGKRPFELSGGMRTRVELAKAIVMERSVLLADEPFAALDTRNASHALNLIKGAVARPGCVAIIALHDLFLAAQHFSRAIRLVRPPGDGNAAGPLTLEVIDLEALRLSGLSDVAIVDRLR